MEGMDDAFLEWRAQHGQEWARYYGLTVSPLPSTIPAAICRCLQERVSELSQQFHCSLWSLAAVPALLECQSSLRWQCTRCCSLHAVRMQELPTSRAQVDQVTMRTRSMLPPPRQAAQLLSRETSRSAPLRLDCPNFPPSYFVPCCIASNHCCREAACKSKRVACSTMDHASVKGRTRKLFACDMGFTVMHQLTSCMSTWVPMS